MLDNLLAWLADWRHPAVIAAAVVLLYLARDGAQRLLRTAFLFAAHGLRLVDRWIRAGAEAAMSRRDRELMATLAGAQPDASGHAVGEIARYAQAAFGFVIPFALAFLGFAIEALIRNGRVVAQLAIGAMLQVASFLVRLLRQLVLGVLSVLLALYDFAIFLPLFIERKWREARS